MRFPAFLAALSALTVLLCACAPQSDTGDGRKLADSSSGASAAVPSSSLPADSSDTTTSQSSDLNSYDVPIMPPDSSRFMGPDYSSEEFVPTLPPEALEPQTIVTVSRPTISDPELRDLTYQYKSITKQDLLALPAGLTYREILDRLGKTERVDFVQTEVLRYLYDVDQEKVLIVSCKSKDDVCPDSGAALYDQCVAYNFDVDDAIIKGADHPATAVCLFDNVFYSASDYSPLGGFKNKYRSIRYEHYENYGGSNSKTYYTKFSFSDGSPASEKDVKPGTQIVYWGLMGTMHQAVAYFPPIYWPSHIVIMK